MDDPTIDPKFGRVGKQKIEDTGALTRKRMETFDGEVLGTPSTSWTASRRGKPFFLWFNSTRIHFHSHSAEYIQMARRARRGRRRHGEHDEQVGALLKKLEELGIADNTIVIYTTDNGNERSLAGRRLRPVPRREGHHVGGWRARADARALARQIKPGTVSNGIRTTRTVRHPRPRRATPTSRPKLRKGTVADG